MSDVDGAQVLGEAAAAYRLAFGERLLAAYALGSLAHGGFSPLVSDIDLGLIVSDPLRPGDARTIRAVADSQKRKAPPLHERLSVFWGTPATLRGEEAGGRFPAVDRLDLIENGRLLNGSEDVRRSLPRPTADELLTSGAEFALDHLAGRQRAGSPAARLLRWMRRARQDAIQEIGSPDLLVGRGMNRVTKLVLFPVRFLYTATTGRVGTNDAAVTHYLKERRAPSQTLVAAALAWRSAPPPEQAVASELLSEELLPLYLYYIDDHIARLDSLAEAELAGAFRGWRDRLAP